MEKLISRKEAAKLLGISIATLDAARNSGLISYVQYVQAYSTAGITIEWLTTIEQCKVAKYG